jgi:transposase
MATRSKVELFEQIRKTGDREELSIRELSRRFGVHRRTVREALASPIPPPRQTVVRPAPVLGPWKAIIDGWLEDDRTAPRKQRHTARRIWQRLVEEHHVEVGESSVRRYVAEARRQSPMAVRAVMVPQTHPLGDEGEVDFGSVSFYLDGFLTEGWMFVMRLSASGKGFHRVYLNQAQEVFLDGHVRSFDRFGAVPGRIRYDNLKPAVTRVLKGRDRDESDRFIALRSHFGFDSFFCIPGVEGAHEKGGVEGEIGRFRRRHLVPMPRVASMAELNELMAAADEKDDHRHIDGRTITVGDHFAIEVEHLRALPAERFDTHLALTCRVDAKSRICVRQCLYSVPVRFAGRRVDVRLGAETVEALDGKKVVACHPRGVVKGAQVLVLDHYLEVLKVKPGALPGATALTRARAAGAFTAVHDEFWGAARRRLGDGEGTRALIEVLLAHRIFAAEAVLAGMRAALKVGSVDPDVVIVEIRKAAEKASQPPGPAVPIGDLSRYDRPKPTLDGYDNLLEAQ